MKIQSLYTIGYEGLTIDTFLAILQSHKIERIIDIRRNPISRKSGFSKSAFGKALASTGVDYVHLVALGTPSPIRHDLKENEDYDAFFASLEEYLEEQIDILHQAITLALEKPSALLCFERNPEKCHRLAVAAHMSRLSQAQLTIEHIRL